MPSTSLSQPVSARLAPTPEPSVEHLMGRMAAGDRAAIFELRVHHGHRVAQVVRRELERCGCRWIAPDDLDGLVVEACCELYEVASAWRPGGALPWWWARGRILQLARRHVGVHADSLDDSHRTAVDDAPVASTLDEDVAETLRRMASTSSDLQLLRLACASARIDEDALVCLLEYRMHQDHGDPSPAHTLAPRYGVSAQTLRKRVSRAKRRLGDVVRDDERFRALSDLALTA